MHGQVLPAPPRLWADPRAPRSVGGPHGPLMAALASVPPGPHHHNLFPTSPPYRPLGGPPTLIALMADVHSNAPALEAVVSDARAAGATHFVCAGDITGFGPSAQACVDTVRAICQVVVRGNHDNALSEGVDCGCHPALSHLARAAEKVARSQLGTLEAAWLRRLPLEESLYLSGRQLYAVHGSPMDPLHGCVAPSPKVEQVRREFMAVDADFVVLGHTHRQLVLPSVLETGVLVNPGSVGFPTDGDPRAAYALLDFASGSVHARHVDYDVDRAVADARSLDARERALYERVLRKGALPD